MPSIKLKLDGKPWSLKPETPGIDKAAAFLRSAPADELFTVDELSSRLKVHSDTLLNARRKREDLRALTEKIGNRIYWGSPAAIAELRKQVRS